MSVFAKIFIVLNLFLSILFLGVAATVLTQRADYKRQLEEQVTKNQELARTNEKQAEDAKARTETLTEDIRTLQAREEQAVKDLASVRGENLKLTTKFDQQHQLLVALKDSYVSQATALGEENKRNEQLFQYIANAEKKTNEYKDAMERAKNQAYAAMADNQRLQEELLAKDQTIRDVTNELNEYKSKIEHLRAQGIDVARLAETKVPAPLDGKIVAVHTGVGLVMVNLGEKHGVEKGMNFTVYRGDQYVGQVIVEEVFPDMASARIDPRFQKLEVREGDDVTTRIR